MASNPIGRPRSAAIAGPGEAAKTGGIFGELAVSTVMVCLTVAIHAARLFMLGRLLGLEEREEAAEHIHPHVAARRRRDSRGCGGYEAAVRLGS